MRVLTAWMVGVVLVAPLVVAGGHLEAPANVRVEAGNQVLRISWDPVEGAAGYSVYVYARGALVDPDGDNVTYAVTGTSATHVGAVNDQSYAVVVAARGAEGVPGLRSDPVAATPTLRHDQTYLALGLIVVWVGIWGYAVVLTRIERGLAAQRERIEKEKLRQGSRP